MLNAKTRKQVLDIKKQDVALNYGVRGHKGSLEPIPASTSDPHVRRSSVSPSKRAGLETIGPTVDANKRLPSIFQKYLNLHPVQEDVVSRQKVFEKQEYARRTKAAALERYAMTFKNVANLEQAETSSRGSSAPGGRRSASRNFNQTRGQSTIAEEVPETEGSRRGGSSRSHRLALETVKKEPEGPVVCFCRDKRKCNHGDMTGLIQLIEG